MKRFHVLSFKKAALTIALTGLALLTPSAASAQDPCIGSLILDKGSLDFREASSISLARLLQQSSSSSSVWGGNITVPIYGVPVNSGAKGAEEATETFFENSQLQWTNERLVSVATQTLSKNAVEVYRICAEGQRRSGPRIIVHNATRHEATVTISWTAPARARTSSGITLTMTGGNLNQRFPSRWTSGSAHSRIILRGPDQDLRITADIGGDTDSQFVSHIPIVERPRVLLVGSCFGRGGQEGVRLWGPAFENCNGVHTWGKYDGQVRAITALGSCVGKGGFDGVRLYGPVGEPCGGIPPWGTYDDPVSVTGSGISSCIGHGNILEGHRLWGPHGASCGGMQDWAWRKYDEFNKRMSALE